MKTVKKSTIDELLRVVRKYAKTGDTDILTKKLEICSKLSVEAFGSEGKWLQFADLAGAVVGVNPLVPGASNQVVYDVLKVIRIEVVEE